MCSSVVVGPVVATSGAVFLFWCGFFFFFAICLLFLVCMLFAICLMFFSCMPFVYYTVVSSFVISDGNFCLAACFCSGVTIVKVVAYSVALFSAGV